jgi:type IV pilus assembly protein PilO
MKLSELQNLDPNNIGSWPLPVKAVVIVALCVAVLFGGYYVVTEPQMVELAKVEQEERDLKDTFEAKQRKAANLGPLKRQLAEMEQQFGGLLRLLPDKTQIDGLLLDISKAGLASGLEFELFKPLAEQPADFYAVSPISIRVIGGYHEFGEFISTVAALPRIVTQHDISIKPRVKRGPNSPQPTENPLVMKLTAKTYRYLEEGEGG